MKATNYFANQRTEIKNTIKEFLKDKATDDQILSIISGKYGFKHSTIKIMIKEARVEIENGN